MTETFQLGDSTIKIVTVIGDPTDRVRFINVHEDETTSIETVIAYSKTTAVHFERVVHNGTRNITFSISGKFYAFDPNRIFTKGGRKDTLKKQGNYSLKAAKAVRELAEKLLSLIPERTIVVSMHNNTDVNYSIKSYQPGGDEAPNTRDVYVNPEMDPDDFIYTTVPAYFDAFSARKINVILQDNENCVDDGSLSVYCGKKGIPYLNIEAQKGHFDQQLWLIQQTMEILKGL